MKKTFNIPKQEIVQLLNTMCFTAQDGETDVYSKKYGETIITINIGNNRIGYPNAMKIHNKATSNFNKRENLVVLECIDRLLNKGYTSECIELEKTWRTGGRLDILVKDTKGKSFLMIECKTFGKIYNNEKRKMYNNGDKCQLINYYIQERTTQYLCLYSSIINNDKIHFENSIIDMTSDFSDCDNAETVFNKWNKNFETKGLFDPDIIPYKIEFKGLLYKDLNHLEDNSSSLIYNQFEEILRRNVVSDKSNAFNKIFNLFICKIVDEDAKNSTNDEMDFQWRENDKYELLFDRLNSLYKKGAKEYINIEVEDLNNIELESLLNTSENNEKIKNVFTKLRLYKNNEFAFKEVYNEETFLSNALIVKEVVQLLQPFRLKYNYKQQFLGDFFELLLNTGFNQEAGQYFTPLPLARFICKSLPIKHIIEKKNNNKEKFFLPYVIDYASGSGHFLTEIMDEINQYIKFIVNDKNYIKGGKNARDEFDSYCNNYKWAKEYIYGIEKDYRLAKTAKINTFLNGDGETNIIMGDGLDDFEESKTYIKKLKEIKRN
jgi:type I restriction enzyme M protein